MWVPEPMTRFLFATTESDLTDILDFIGKEGKFHIAEFSHRYLKEPGYKDIYFRLQDYQKRIKEIIEYFDIDEVNDISFDSLELSEIADKAEKFLGEFQEKLGNKKDRLVSLKKEEDELNLTSELLSLLPESETNVEELHNSDFLRMVGGTIPASEEEDLLDIIKDRDIIVFSRKFQNASVPLIIFYSFFEKDSINEILEAVHFKKLELFSSLKGPLSSLKDTIENKFWEIKEERTALKASIKKMGRNFEKDILKLQKNIEISMLELDWVLKTARSEKFFFISSYLPTKVVPEVKEKAGNLELYILVEEDIRREDEDAYKTPTKLNNPLAIRPFELLVRSYGVPSYRGIDPTIFTSLSFIFFFGIMFGDLGHGLVLVLAGIGLYFVKVLRRFAIFPLALGISSSVFGTFFGEFFGTHPFEPLWFSPFETPEKALLLAVYLGILVIIFGFVLRLVEYTMEKDKDKLLLSGHGLPGFIFYISIIMLAFSVMKSDSTMVIRAESAVLGISALVIAVGAPLKNSINKGWNSDKLLLSLGDLIHLSLSMISNTLSFIRIAAFNIGHVILTMSIIEISDVLGEMIGFGGYTTLVFGNIVIIALEGMIVFIQGIRLEYYELYSRFFERGKEIYEPVKIK
jgi:V/A-type H+/Na+-transporting ATPase subunit I